MYCYKVKKSKKYLFIILAVIFCIGVFIFSFFFLNNKREIKSEYTTLKASQTPKKVEIDKYSMLEKTMKCIVGISSVKIDGTSIFDLDGVKTWGNGTGFIVSPNGYIVTNEHVAGNKGHKTDITLENGMSYKGSTVWSNSDIDVGIIKINETDLDYLDLGNSENILLGKEVYAIGNPIGFEFQRTVTSRNN